MAAKFGIVRHDNWADRRELVRGLLPAILTHHGVDGLTAFVQWSANFAWLTSPKLAGACGAPVVSYDPSAVRGARESIGHAVNFILNAAYCDLIGLGHESQIDLWVAFLIEAENRAKLREPTPVEIAVAGWREAMAERANRIARIENRLVCG